MTHGVVAYDVLQRLPAVFALARKMVFNPIHRFNWDQVAGMPFVARLPASFAAAGFPTLLLPVLVSLRGTITGRGPARVARIFPELSLQRHDQRLQLFELLGLLPQLLGLLPQLLGLLLDERECRFQLST